MCSREMKNSGVQWIGKIPKEWSIAPLGQYLKERNEKVSDKDFEPLSVTKQGVMKQLENVAKTDNNDNRKKVCKGDFVINSRSNRKQSCGLSELDGSVSVINIVLKNIGIEEKYLKYVLKNYGFAEEFYRWGSGIVADLWSTKYEKMKRIMIPIPDNGAKVGDYLDKKVSQIDYIILNQRRLIEKYKAYKQSLITETVTKGLNKNVPMKDSGIEWIGEIPETWNINKLKYICDFQTGTTPPTNEKQYFDGDVNWFTPSDFNKLELTNSSRKLTELAIKNKVVNEVDKYTTLIIGIGGTAGKIGYTNVKCSFNQQITALITNKINNRYLMYWMISKIDYVKSTTLYTTLPILNNETLKGILIAIGSKDEQQQIVDFLDKRCKVIESVISKKEQLIEELESYKKSLIYECVTGKREMN